MAVTDRIEGLYSTEQRGLLSLAWLILGSREAAEDAVQECFARLGVRGIDDIDNPAGYLRSMVLNECRRTIRHRRRVQPTAEMAEGLHLDSYLGELTDALARLTPKRRMAVVLRYYADLPVIEIAEVMSCRPSTVSSLINRAMKDLKEALR